VSVVTKQNVAHTLGGDGAQLEAGKAQIRGPYRASDTNMMASLSALEDVHFFYVLRKEEAQAR